MSQWLDSLDPIRADQVRVYLDDNSQAPKEIMTVLSKRRTQSADHEVRKTNETAEQISDWQRAVANNAWATIRARENSSINSKG